MDVIEAIHSRRSVRAYAARPLARELIEALIWDAAQAPPPALRRIGRTAFVVIEGQVRLAEFGERAMVHARASKPANSGPGWMDDPDFKIFWDAPALILICGLSLIAETPWDCCRAGQNLMLSAHARGLGSCWVGSPLPWLATAEGAAAVGVPEGYAAVAPIVVGYPATVPASREVEPPRVIWG